MIKTPVANDKKKARTLDVTKMVHSVNMKKDRTQSGQENHIEKNSCSKTASEMASSNAKPELEPLYN